MVSFVPLEDGDEVEIEPGWQGGQHIWMLLRAREVANDCYLQPTYHVFDDSGDEALITRYYGGQFYPLPDDPEQSEFLAFAFFVAEPEEIHRRPVTLYAEISDGCGNLISDSVTVTPYDTRLDSPTSPTE